MSVVSDGSYVLENREYKLGQAIGLYPSYPQTVGILFQAGAAHGHLHDEDTCEGKTILLAPLRDQSIQPVIACTGCDRSKRVEYLSFRMGPPQISETGVPPHFVEILESFGHAEGNG